MSPKKRRSGRRAAALSARASSRRRGSWSASSRPPRTAREEGWPYEQFLEVAAGGRGLRARRLRRRATASATPPSRPTRRWRTSTSPPSPPPRRPLILHLAQLAWIDEHTNVCFFGPPGTGKTHLAIALAIKACQAGHRVAFATAQQWVDRLEGKPSTATRSTPNSGAWSATACSSSTRSATCPLERQAANLLFALVARRYERGSIIVTSNRGFEAWGEILGDAMVAAALIDRLVHHAHMITLKGKSYRLRERGSRPRRRPRSSPPAYGRRPESRPPDHPDLLHYSLPESCALFGSC